MTRGQAIKYRAQGVAGLVVTLLGIGWLLAVAIPPAHGHDALSCGDVVQFTLLGCVSVPASRRGARDQKDRAR